ncbi:FHIPEP family type III secretion protein, partial [Myxococcota bacterium]|nr:FHIPEP family type III secretion protein [Myxococcota bacterium]
MRQILDIFMGGGFASASKRYADIILAGLVIGTVGMMIIPLPTPVMDLMLVLNITIQITMMMIAIYISSATDLSVYPTIILITTLFRLSLNVSTTRLILLQADAGEVIDAFGQFVVRGNFIVGAVIFLIITIVQFLVVAKGSERVAEVAARFTLDAMPGKQMSIDADLRAGAFDLDEARRRRQALGEESQLFGSMDGAMKFVKGDTIAGLIITVINIVAGILIGITMMDMTAGEAIQRYGILTIGDGLVSQIPALISSMTAGLIVTRVSGSEDDKKNLGAAVSEQVLAFPKAFAIAAGILIGMGLVPGLPTVPFFIMSGLIGLVAFGLMRSKAETLDGDEPANEIQALGEEAKQKQIESSKKQEGQAQQMLPVVTPIALEVSANLIPLVEDTGGGNTFLGEMVPMMRDGLFYELGVKFPGIRVRGNETDLPDGTYIIMINEIPLISGNVSESQVLVNDTVDRLTLLNIKGEEAVNPANGSECAWIPAEYAEIAEQAGLTTWDAAGYMVL